MSSALRERIARRYSRAGSGTRLLIALVMAGVAMPSAQAQTYSLIYSFQCGTDGSNPYGGLVRDASGDLYGTTYLGGALGNGVVFKLTSSGTLIVLHAFAGGPTDGVSPVATLAREGAGNLFGTTGKGGAYDYGTVFKVTPNGTETLLHSFVSGKADGAYPYPGLMLDGAGNLYGTTVLGGTFDAGTAFKISATGGESLLYSFGAYSGDGQHPHAGLFRDAAGNLYGTTLDGGSFGDGTVFKLAARGSETLLHSFAGYPGDGEHPHTVLVQDTAENFYGTTLDGGAFSRGTVFELTATGAESLLHSFAGSPGDGQRPHVGVVRDAAGNLYGTTLDGGAFAYGAVFEVTSTGTESLLHSFANTTFANTTKDGGSAENGLVRDSAGHLYGTTYYGGASGCGAVFKYTP